MTKKLELQEKFNRKPIHKACKFCHQKHLKCDLERPCKNCIKKGISNTCENIERKKSKYFKNIYKNEKLNNFNEIQKDKFKKKIKFKLISSLIPESYNEEYIQLTDLLDNTCLNSINTEFQTSFQLNQNKRPYISLSDNSIYKNGSDPYSFLDSSISYYTSPLILRHLIKQPEDVYNTPIQPYNYPKAYHALLNYLKTRFKKNQLITIARSMAKYRPSFIAATRSLVEMDLLFAERSFQRSLLEYESMSLLSSSPTIIWRRTGEIVAVSTEFSSLISHTKTELLSKRTFIIELMNEKSTLDYFKLFSSVAFGDLNGVIITECTLLSPNGEEIKCASTWTVKRDLFDIPMLIVGQFLPIL